MFVFFCLRILRGLRWRLHIELLRKHGRGLLCGSRRAAAHHGRGHLREKLLVLLDRRVSLLQCHLLRVARKPLLLRVLRHLPHLHLLRVRHGRAAQHRHVPGLGREEALRGDARHRHGGARGSDNAWSDDLLEVLLRRHLLARLLQSGLVSGMKRLLLLRAGRVLLLLLALLLLQQIFQQ